MEQGALQQSPTQHNIMQFAILAFSTITNTQRSSADASPVTFSMAI